MARLTHDKVLGNVLVALGLLAGLIAALVTVWNNRLYHWLMLGAFVCLALSYLIKPQKNRWDWVLVAVLGANIALLATWLITKA